MFGPKWKKEAKHLLKGAKKFLNYKRDLLKQDRIDEIESRRADLLAAIKGNDEAKATEAGKQLRNTCEKALPRFPVQSWWEENVEVIWVALVVALGLRAYVLQPFRIPTGSMQPTLNGIVVNNFPDPSMKAPNFLKQGWEMLTRGRSYSTIIAQNDSHIVGLKDTSWFLFTKTEVTMSDGTKIVVPAAKNEAFSLFAIENPGAQPIPILFKKGQTILNGYIDTGDLVLVDKMSYHFRSPKRGEVFVFDTRGINTGGGAPSNLSAQTGGTHYIKRLSGVPGDQLQVHPPDLFVNGKISPEWGNQRVMKAEGIYAAGVDGRPASGYQLVPQSELLRFPGAMATPDTTLSLKKDAPRGMREYAALGDNTGNSLDSRFWGPVKEYNLVGAGFFTLWPFTTGHWGFIR